MGTLRDKNEAPYSTWYGGTPASWRELPQEERERIAFEATGCEVAYPTWEAPVDCLHTGCQIRRGEIPASARLNRQLRGEAENGWLRFVKDRTRLARIFRAIRRQGFKTGIFDVWKMPGVWQCMVGAGVMDES